MKTTNGTRGKQVNCRDGSELRPYGSPIPSAPGIGGAIRFPLMVVVSALGTISFGSIWVLHGESMGFRVGALGSTPHHPVIRIRVHRTIAFTTDHDDKEPLLARLGRRICVCVALYSVLVSGFN